MVIILSYRASKQRAAQAPPILERPMATKKESQWQNQGKKKVFVKLIRSNSPKRLVIDFNCCTPSPTSTRPRFHPPLVKGVDRN
jgi:hypothetical protein